MMNAKNEYDLFNSKNITFFDYEDSPYTTVLFVGYNCKRAN